MVFLLKLVSLAVLFTSQHLILYLTVSQSLSLALWV